VASCYAQVGGYFHHRAKVLRASVVLFTGPFAILGMINFFNTALLRHSDGGRIFAVFGFLQNGPIKKNAGRMARPA
tara:strand:- start:236 stop:463 length:228 start_codon:yes stop_codon:yes gene_type:complete